MGWPPRSTISARPWVKSRTSSGLANDLCSTTWVMATCVPPLDGMGYAYLLIGKLSMGSFRPRIRGVRDGLEPAGTAARILDVAERLVQSRGFNGFSYADVASELGVTKASLHYHFPGKAELGESLISRYAARFAAALAAIDEARADAPTKLEAYAQLYADVLGGERMCLCGM